MLFAPGPTRAYTARGFNGTSDYLLQSSFHFAEPWSLSLFFKQSGASNPVGMALIGRGGGLSNGVEVQLSGDSGSVNFNKQFTINVSSANILTQRNRWNHVGLTYDGTVSKWSINGKFAGSFINAASIDYSGTLNIGAFNNGGGDYLNGNECQVAVWNGATLTQKEFTDLANGANPLSIRRGKLAAWWPLAGFSSPEPDLSGNGNDLTVAVGTFRTDGPMLPLQYSNSDSLLWIPQGITLAASPNDVAGIAAADY